MSLDRAYAEKLDAADPLAGYRERFLLEDPALIYLNGNSLGALPLATLRRVENVLREEWGTALARSWDHWVDLPARAGDMVGQLIGAAPGQVIVTDNTTVNLYKLVIAALDARPGRHVIITDRDNFPTDRYVVEGIAAQRRAELRMLPTDINEGLDPDLVRDAVDEDTAVVSLSHVAYRSGALADMAAITQIAHQAGRGGLLCLERLDHNPVFERLDYYLGGGRHDLTSPSGKANGELLERASVAACRRGCQTASSH